MSVLEMCKKIGIETQKDLKRFKNEEKMANESLKQALIRYYNELGGESFKIREEQI